MFAAKNLQKNFICPVLKSVTIEVKPGETIGIAGENGSGKSTLLSIMAGLTRPDSGEISVDGKVGYVPQENALFDNLSVMDNIRFWASAYGINLKNIVPFPFNLLDDGDFLKKKVKHLSGGMKKRLSIALACLHDPKWLLLDEPSSALDIGFKGILHQIIADICKEGGAVIFTTHQPDELLWCSRIYILRDGIFIYEGEPLGMEELSKILYS